MCILMKEQRMHFAERKTGLTGSDQLQRAHNPSKTLQQTSKRDQVFLFSFFLAQYAQEVGHLFTFLYTTWHRISKVWASITWCNVIKSCTIYIYSLYYCCIKTSFLKFRFPTFTFLLHQNRRRIWNAASLTAQQFKAVECLWTVQSDL